MDISMNNHKVLLNIFYALVVAFATYLGFAFTNDGATMEAFWPAIGFVVALYYVFNNKIIFGLFFGLLLGQLFNFIVFTNYSYLDSFLYSILFTVIGLLEAYIFKISVKDKWFIELKNLKNLLFILLAFAFAAFIGGILIAISCIFIPNDFSVFTLFGKWILGELSGFFIIGTGLLLAFKFDDKLNIIDKRKTMYGTLFLCIFYFFSFILFKQIIPGFDYVKFSFLFIPFYMLAMLLFSYRIIVFLNMIFIFNYVLFYIPTLDTISLNSYIFGLNLFLITITSISLYSRYLFVSLDDKNIELAEYKNKLEDLFKSTYKFFEIGDELVRKDQSVNETYLLQLFNTISKMFDIYDSATCFVDTGEYVKFIGCINYDLEDLNKLKFSSSLFNWDNLTPNIFERFPEDVHNLSKDKKIELNRNYPIIKETLSFCISLEGDIRGGMSFDINHPSTKKFRKSDVDMISHVQNLMNGFYINSLKTYKNISLKNDLVFSLIRTLGLFDNYTSDHSISVAKLCEITAQTLKLDEKLITDIYWAGLVHDIGKVGINPEILNKSEKLTQSEYNLIKQHPIFGYDLLSVSEDLHDIAKIVLEHHEWYDGNGYPNNKKADEISLSAQILSVCDSISAMACDRPYKKGKSKKEIIKELNKYKGSQFSPIIVEAIIPLLESNKFDNIIFCDKKNLA